MRNLLRIIILLVLGSVAFAQDTEPDPAIQPVESTGGETNIRSLIAEGNERFAQGDFEGALERYRIARGESLEVEGALEAAYNEAVALHALGQGGESKDLFRQVEASPDAGRLAAMSRFNQGVIEYEARESQAEGAPGVNPEARIGELEDAERSFRRALDLDPRDRDAAKNLELTRRELEQMRQLLEQLQQQQQQQEGEQDQQEQDEQQQQQQQNQQQQQGGQGQPQEQEQDGEPRDPQQQEPGEQETPESESQQQEVQLGEGGEEEDLAARLIEREEDRREQERRARREREPVEKDW